MISIIQKRKIFFVLSGILILGSIVAFGVFGFRLGIDFTGGSLLEVSLESDASIDTETVHQVLTDRLPELTQLRVQSSGDSTILIRTIPLTDDGRQNILSALTQELVDAVSAPVTVTELRFESVGPTLGSELKRKALEALIVAAVVIVVYIAWSFRKVSQSTHSDKRMPSSWKYGVGAIVALVHDLIIATGAYLLIGSFLDLRIDALFVTALLVILGYSVNDTIVVYDRIRENLIRDEGKTLFDTLVNQSVNQTIARSINTSFTTLLVLFSLLIFGGESLYGFVVALILGVLVGTYSSIFVASPILVVWEQYMAHRRS